MTPVLAYIANLRRDAPDINKEEAGVLQEMYCEFAVNQIV